MWLKGWKLAKMHIWSLPVRSSTLCAIERTALEPNRELVCSSTRSMTERMPHQPHIPRCPSHHCFTPCAVGGYVRLSTHSSVLERTHVYFVNHIWRRPQRPKTSLFFTINPLNCHLFIYCLFLFVDLSLFNMRD
jgi:hypothetical protein